jgi:hypothetical protein
VSTMRCPLDPAATTPAVEEVMSTLRQWRLQPGPGRVWVRQAADSAGDAPAELLLEYDATIGLVSLEAWRDGRRLFGIDDFVGTA